MDAEQMETLVGMRLAKYPDRACMMQEMTFKDEKITALEIENARLRALVELGNDLAQAVREWAIDTNNTTINDCDVLAISYQQALAALEVEQDV